MEFNHNHQLNPMVCPACGVAHEPQYPHSNTAQFRRHVSTKLGRAANSYDLIAHTQGLIWETAMIALLQKIEVR